MSPPRLHRVLVPLALLLPASLAAQQPTWALTNARIETVTRGVIPRGTIVIRDGLITAVGADLTPPADARVLDLDGATVSPGLIDLTTTLGLPVQAPSEDDAPRGMDPDRVVSRELAGDASAAKASRDAGVTAALSAPNRGLFRGQSALVVLADTIDGRAVLRSPVGSHIGYQGLGRGQYPTSLLGVIAAQRQWMFDAARYGMIMDRWAADPRGIARPEHDPKLEALVPVARGTMPAFVAARNENEIRRADRLAREHGLDLTVVGAVEGWRAVETLRGHDVVVELNFPAPRMVTGWGYRGGLPTGPADSAAMEATATRAIEGNPAALHQAGVRFALASGGTRGSEFVANLKKAIAAGLPADVALAGATIRAAELAGVGGALGSIEAGKIANLVVSTGPLLGDSGQVSHVFVRGSHYEVTAPAPRASGRGAGNGGAGAASIGGTWVITTESPQGTSTGTLVVTQEAGAGTFSGTVTNEMFGDSPVTAGRISGNRVSWTLTLSFGGQSFDLSYSGEVTGDRMTGTVTAGSFGSFPFTGEKKP